MSANPVDRGKPGSKLHLVSDGGGLPLTAANVNYTLLFAALLMTCPRCARRRDGGGAGLARSMPIRPMTMRPTAPTYAVAGSHRGSPGVGSSPRPGWDATGGGSSGRCRGCRVTGVWRFAGIGTRSGGLGSCCWPVRLFASRLYRQQDRNERQLLQVVRERSRGRRPSYLLPGRTRPDS